MESEKMAKCNSDLQYEDVKPELEDILDLYLEDEPTKNEIVSHLLSYIENLVKDEKVDLENDLDESYGDTCGGLESEIYELKEKLGELEENAEREKQLKTFYSY